MDEQKAQGKGPKHLGNRWYKGQPPANPKGRPRTGLAFSEMARDHDKAEERFAVVLALALRQPVIRAFDADGKPMTRPLEPGEHVRAEVYWPTDEVVLRANEFINSWAYQKPPAQVELTTKDEPTNFDWKKLGENGLGQLIEQFAIASGASQGAPLPAAALSEAPQDSAENQEPESTPPLQQEHLEP